VNNETVSVVVLNDGETFSGLEGCCIVVLTKDQLERVSNGSEKIYDVTPILEIGLNEYQF